MDMPTSVFEAFGHTDTCNVWVPGQYSIHLDRSRLCDCGGESSAVAPDGPQERCEHRFIGNMMCLKCGREWGSA